MSILKKIILSLCLCTTVYFTSLLFSKLLENYLSLTLIDNNFWISPIIKPFVLLVFSFIAILLLSKYRISNYGFNIPQHFYFKNTFIIGFLIGFIGSLLVILTLPQELASIYQNPIEQTILITWIFTPVAIEIFSKGLMLSYLSPLKNNGIKLSKIVFLSIPVLLSAFYGIIVGSDLQNIGQNKLFALILIIFGTPLAIASGYYREKSDSLIPSFMVHIFANFGGAIPAFIFIIP